MIDLSTCSAQELENLADEILKWDANRSVCPVCGLLEIDRRDPSPECEAGHTWDREDSQRKGWDSSHGLLASHMKERRRREIYTASGTPDPAYASGIFGRPHRDRPGEKFPNAQRRDQ